MIGGPEAAVRRLDPIFKTLAPGRGSIDRTPGREHVGGTAEDGYLHCGPTGAGHFVKMVHNGVEYGLMAAYAEGLNIYATPTSARAAARSTRRRRRCATPSITAMTSTSPTSRKCGGAAASWPHGCSI